MSKESNNQILNNYPFLQTDSAKEPYLLNILLEIDNVQKRFLSGKGSGFATRSSIYKSRNIKMPVTPSRDKNIDYILEHLLENYDNNFKKIDSFDFDFNAKKKQLQVKEIEEFTVNLPAVKLAEIAALRDNNSVFSLLKLISRFRIFNLTKLFSFTKNKSALSRIIKIALGKSIFTYKNYRSNSQRIEVAEDFCFHINNYDHVKKSLDNERLKEIVAMHMDILKRKLENYGLYNAHFSDYRDKKIDYILHILIDDISPSVTAPDQIFIKNYQSLRKCLMKVDQIMDPAQIHGGEIIKFIKDNQYITATQITSDLIDVDIDTLNKWATNETLAKEHVIKHTDDNGYEYYIDGENFITTIEDMYQVIRFKPETFSSMPTKEKNDLQNKMDVYYLSATKHIDKNNSRQYFNTNSEGLEKLKKIVTEYEEYLTELSLRSENNPLVRPRKRKESIIKKIISFFASIFSSSDEKQDEATISSSSKSNKGISRETRQVFAKAKAKKGPVIALSDFIELSRENDHKIDQIINDLRNNNIKIVIPIYNARSVLYPKRSQKYLIPDIEYLLAPVSAITSQETITSYIDSLVGIKLKDDFVGGKALIAIERYLRTIYRQKRATMHNKKQQKKAIQKKKK